MKLYKLYKRLIVPLKTTEGKFTCLAVFCENSDFLSVYPRLKILPSFVKYVFVPLITKLYPHRLTADYRNAARSFRLIPITDFLGEFSKVPPRNFFLDYTGALQSLINRFKIKNYRSAVALRRFNELFSTLNTAPSYYEKVLLYCVCVDETITPIIMQRKFFPIYLTLLQWFNGSISDLPFDKILLFVYSKTSSTGKYMLIFDKQQTNQLSRLRGILINLRMLISKEYEGKSTSDEGVEVDLESKEEELSNSDVEELADHVVSKTTLIDDKDKEGEIGEQLKKLVADYMKLTPYYAQQYKEALNMVVDEVDDSELSAVVSVAKKEEEKQKTEKLELSSTKPENVKTNFVLRTLNKTVKPESSFDVQDKLLRRTNVLDNFRLKILSKNALEKLAKIDEKTENKADQIVLSSVIHNRVGDLDKTIRLTKTIMDPRSKEVLRLGELLKKEVGKLIPKEKSKCVSIHPIIKISKPQKILENTNPSHILNKRIRDFENLDSSILEIFGLLRRKKYPLKVRKLSKIAKKDDSSVLGKTDLLTYNIQLVDYKGRVFDISFDLPLIDEHGFFTLYGKKRVIIYQLVTQPIFFFKPYVGSFVSMYSMISVYSKITQKDSYLYIHMAGEKFPLLMILCSRKEFFKVLKDYSVDYQIVDLDKTSVIKTEGLKFKIGKTKYLIVDSKKSEGMQLISALSICMKYMPKIESEDEFLKNLNTTDFWKETIYKYTGNRNVLYNLDQIWNNIVTPTEIKILLSKGLPTKLYDIIRHISTLVVTGYVDDRNSLEKQRVRTIEIISNLLFKQVSKAYNEYENKVESGDPRASFYFASKSVLIDIVTSQNIQLVENINPIEELAVLTRVTPIGIGGVASAEALPTKALDIHPSYYGNIDTLETPDGPNVGVQQHLALGSAISDLNGTFFTKNKDKIDPTEILSVGPSSIPFVESNEGARVLMASNQIKQALPLKNPEIPAIQTGIESILPKYLSDSFVKKSPVDGTVIEITNKYILIKDSKNRKHAVDISEREVRSGQGKHGLSIFRPLVSVASKVSKQQIIAEGACLKNSTISNGINVLVAYIPWKGYNFEDGMVVSEELVEKFTSVHNEIEEVLLEEDDEIIAITEVGKTLKKGDVLLGYTKLTQEVSSYMYLRTDGGIVSSIEVYSNLKENRIPKLLIPAYENFKKEYITINGSYPSGKFKYRNTESPFKGILVRFKVNQFFELKKGDKLNNRHFNKGVVAIIEKKENMPVTPWGESVQMVYNPLAIVNRMISGQLLEMHTGLISKKLAELMIKQRKSEFLKTLRAVMKLLDGTENHEYSKSLIDGLIKMSDAQYKKVVKQIQNEGFFPLIFPPFKSPKREDILDALNLLGLKPRYKLYLPEYDTTTDPVAVGYVYVMKLEHMSEKKLHARGVGTYTSKTLAPVGGKKRGGGQQFGEYDLYSMLSWGSKYIVDEVQGPLSSDHVTKNEMISEIVKKGDADFRPARTNPVKEFYQTLLKAIHIESE